MLEASTLQHGPAHPESAPQLRVGKLRGQFQVLKADSLSRSLVPGEEHGQLEGGDLQVVLAHLVLEGDLESPRDGLTLNKRATGLEEEEEPSDAAAAEDQHLSELICVPASYDLRQLQVGTHDAVGHQVVPVKLPAAVVLLVEVLHLWDEVFQLCRKGNEDLLAAPGPGSSIQDLYVDRVG